MFYYIFGKLKEWLSSRLIPIAILYVVLAGVLIFQLYRIQILDADKVAEEEEYRSTRERQTASTRGLIYDSEGRVLAYNELSYSVLLEDSPLLNTNEKKNAMLYKLIQILKKENVTLEPEFYIAQGESGILEYTVEGTARLRFIKNALGKQSIDNLTAQEKEMTTTFELKAAERKANLEAELSEMVKDAKLKADSITAAADDSVRRQQVLFDKLRLEIAAFKSAVTSKYKEHLSILQEIPETVPMDPKKMAEVITAKIDAVPDAQSFIPMEEEQPQETENGFEPKIKLGFICTQLFDVRGTDIYQSLPKEYLKIAFDKIGTKKLMAKTASAHMKKL